VRYEGAFLYTERGADGLSELKYKFSGRDVYYGETMSLRTGGIDPHHPRYGQHDGEPRPGSPFDHGEVVPRIYHDREVGDR
jgi:hypothetical protein